ncbi:low temperature requirement protein A [Sphingomonas sp. BT-65]|uniref:low temperature requirement protein A n=1 Tax=Sphingomonas sp. BT-65 TaxID=2989821 RepID=UPI002235FD9E|nr:low temperature requirement protein A [Sphingomonas sp. BT-65]MCW4461302.1 low temperature requirement protein A [Sphingomonas sp. BT-65]
MTGHAAIRPMAPRDPHEPHRVATPLELLFDLVTVIAIAAAAAALHHAIAADHAADGIIGYAVTFFAIWWAWMNYTWFASAYDNDDAITRLLTMLIMGGALLLAAGIERFAAKLDFSLVVGGYAVMRLGMIAMWLRAAWNDPPRRAGALRYAGGIALAQLYWAGLYFSLPPQSPALLPLILLGWVIELSVPAIAERAAETPWHRHHIVERYGLLMIIVLGEVLLAATLALEKAWDGSFDMRLAHTALSALVIAFAMWWLYFAREPQLSSNRLSRSLQWGYGHLIVFASGAAVGAGFAVLVEILTGHARLSLRAGDLAVAVPLGIYLLSLWLVRDRFELHGAARWVLPLFAAAIVALPFAFPALEAIAALAVAAVAVRAWLAARDLREAAADA